MEMKQISSLKLIITGFILLVIGVVLPFLMVIRLLEPSFLLSFLSYFASLVGLIMGLCGVAWYVRSRRRNMD